MSLTSDNKKEKDLLVFKAESEDSSLATIEQIPWQVLVVDDDEQVHRVTTLALSDITVLNRKIEFIHAYNSMEAFSILQNNHDVTVILLDVVMETDSAGLDLVKRIRFELGQKAVRIILRTGQPGYAPELEVIQEFDINDYKMKSELTRTRLITSLTTAIRSYEQYSNLELSKNAMEQIIRGSQYLFSFGSMEEYSSKVIEQASALLGRNCESFLVNQYQSTTNEIRRNSEFFIIAVSNKFKRFLDSTLDDIVIDQREQVLNVFQSEISIFQENSAYIFLQSDDKHSGVLYMESDRAFSEQEQQLLKVFAAQVSLGLENLYLLHKLHQSAYFDQLTQLPNRTRFLADIKSRQRKDDCLIVAVLDVDEFAEINNALGHQNGDQLLQAISSRLADTFAGSINIARLGGDTFGVLGPEDEVQAQKLLEPFEDAFVINGTSFPIRATLGLAKLDSSIVDSKEVLKNADMAMKIAKTTPGANYRYYTEEMDKATQERILITRDLRTAIDRGELILNYQPQLNLLTGQIVGVESLMRWIRPGGEIIPPSRFIPVAEQSGLIIDIGILALKQALEFHQHCIDLGHEPFRIAVNISVRQFLNGNFMEVLTELLDNYDIDPNYLELEITESMLMHDVDRVITILNSIKKLGISIAVDDFGTGFSSLNYLLRLPIDRLKIDRSFIINLEHDPRAQTLTQLIVNMAKQLKLDLVAEGVETEQQVAFLKNLNCDEAQGYYYSRPLSIQQFEHWIGKKTK